jgi:hypothetical protein
MMEVIGPATYCLWWVNGQGVPNIWNIEHLLCLYP